MRERPTNISDDALCDCLGAQYALGVAGVEFLPLGQDSSAWVYRVRADDAAYFLKVRKHIRNEASLVVPRYLSDRGLTQVIPPLTNTLGALWTAAGEYALIVYPFVSGRIAIRSGMSDQQWIDYGALLRQIHETDVTPDLERLLKRDFFTPDWAAMVRKLDAHILDRTFDDDPDARSLAPLWQAKRQDIHTLLHTAEDLGQRLAQKTPEQILCHADIHTGNLLLDAEERVWIVDWDETMLAPRERDLMFTMGGGLSQRVVGPREEALFFRGYGATSVDPIALAYYRYSWAVADIGAYGEAVFFRPDLGPLTRHEAVDRWLSLFAPGGIAEIAFASTIS
jgi:spectinomycin phosphotransferase